LRANTVGARDGHFPLEVHGFALRANPVVPGRVAGGLPFRKNAGELLQAIVRSRERRLADLRGHEIGVCRAQFQPCPANLVIGATTGTHA